MLLTEEIKKARLTRAYSGFRNVPEKLHRATQALFWEHRHACRWKQKDFHPPYNLGKKDHDDTLSMAQIYFQCSSEYQAALILLGDWEHWEKLTACNWFQPYITKWRNEKSRRDSAIGRGKVLELAEQGNLAAAKYLDQQSAVKVKQVEQIKVDTPVTPDVVEDDWATAMLKKVGETNDT